MWVPQIQKVNKMVTPKYQRKNLRLRHYDYSQAGLYFVTICGQNRFKYFGEITEGKFIGNAPANMIVKIWIDLPYRFPVALHEYMLMPNHFHAIIEIKQDNEYSLGEIIDAFKSMTTKEYIMGVKDKDWFPFEKRLWQRNYYEHIISDEKSYLKLFEYIQNNPIKWEDNMFFV